MQPNHQLMLSISGTIAEPNPDPQLPPVKWVYQRTAPGMGNLENVPNRDRQRRAYVIPADPQTPAQLNQRAKMAAAITAYRNDQSPYDQQARVIQQERRITYYQAWISAYLQTPPLPAGTSWDGGLTIWDGGSTTFDRTP